MNWQSKNNGYRAEHGNLRFEVWPIGRYWHWRIRKRNAQGYWLEIKSNDRALMSADEAMRQCQS